MEEKNITSNDLIISLGSEDFRQYFRKNILPYLEPIEVLRKELNKKKAMFTNISIVVAVVLFVTSIIMPFFLGCSLTSSNLKCSVHMDPGAGIFVVVIPILTYAIAGRWAKGKFKESTGKKIIPTLFSYWGTFKYCGHPNYTQDGIQGLMRLLKLYPRHDDIVIDDCIKGEYNGLKLKITELDISYETGSGKSRRVVRVFDGLMMEVDIHKRFTSHTVIAPDGTGGAPGFQRVKLEDPEFEREFDVYSNDQIDSRYLLTTAFMRRLVELKMSAKKRVEAVFYGQRAYFFIDYEEDKFELPLNKPVTDMQHYQNILLDLARMLRIVDTLKLEQNIGL